MKVAVIVRTLNEEKNVDRFCQSYINMFAEYSDVHLKILVADGGSTDKTVELLRKYEPYVVIKNFTEQIEIPSRGVVHKVNPRGRHINFLIDWAKSLKPDWIIFDDVDCVPSLSLSLISGPCLRTNHDMIFAYRLFMLGTNRYFPDMNKKKDGESLWAWRPHVPIRAYEKSDLVFEMNIPWVDESGSPYVVHRLHKPNCLLHYFYPDEETFQRKKAQYVATKEVPRWYNPMTQFGKIEDAPEWARWQ